MATYMGYLALSALRSEAESESERACRKANPPTICMYGSPSAIRSGLSPISISRSSARKRRAMLTIMPKRKLKSREVPTTWITLSRCPAPMYCEQRMEVPREMTSKRRNTRFISWLTTPTAATLLSECRLSMNVSTAPSIITSRVSTKIGPAKAVN